MSESPPSLRETLVGGVGFAAVALFVLLVVYAVFFAAEVFVVVYVAFLALLVWLLYRFVLAHERVADAQERRARAAEHRAGIDPPVAAVVDRVDARGADSSAEGPDDGGADAADSGGTGSGAVDAGDDPDGDEHRE